MSPSAFGLSKYPSSLRPIISSAADWRFFCSFRSTFIFETRCLTCTTRSDCSNAETILAISLSEPSIVMTAPDFDLIVAFGMVGSVIYCEWYAYVSQRWKMSREALKQGCTLFAFQPDEDRLSSRGKHYARS